MSRHRRYVYTSAFLFLPFWLPRFVYVAEVWPRIANESVYVSQEFQQYVRETMSPGRDYFGCPYPDIANSGPYALSWRTRGRSRWHDYYVGRDLAPAPLRIRPSRLPKGSHSANAINRLIADTDIGAGLNQVPAPTISSFREVRFF